MYKHKVIIMAVSVFGVALLIIGATYAWLSAIFYVSNSNYNSVVMNFNVVYNSNNARIDQAPVLAIGTPNDAAKVTVVARKDTNSASGTFTLYLNTDTSVNNTTPALLESGAINYAVCVGTCNSFDNITTKGSITSSTPVKYALINTPLNANDTEYNIYFWLDENSISLEDGGNKYTGYISAEATQSE